MFIGRERELSKLTELYNSDKFQCAVIYGRRRVGKTTLINEFVKDKDTIYFTGLESNAKENLEGLSRSIMALSQGFENAAPVFSGYNDAFDVVFNMSLNRRIVMVIDEYPYLAASYNTVSSLLQQYIDKYKDTSKLFLILCGSSLSFMENQVLGYQSPLYGRRTAQFKITPFEFREMKEYYKAYDIYDLALIYGLTGGVPQYMTKIDESLSVKDNIISNFLTPSSYMFEEPLNLVKQECRDPAQYNSIIKAIATGSSKMSEISTKVGIDTGLCSNYLSSLMTMGIIKKETPFREERTKKTIYSIDDFMFRFWYRFIPENMALINKDRGDIVYERISEQIPSFMGGVFEEICKQYLWYGNIKNQLEIEMNFTDLGRWWGNDPIRKSETEIDILAYINENTAIFGECKWTNENVGMSVLDDLIDQSKLFRYKENYYYLFAKYGFTESCVRKANSMGNVVLLSFADMQ